MNLRCIHKLFHALDPLHAAPTLILKLVHETTQHRLGNVRGGICGAVDGGLAVAEKEERQVQNTLQHFTLPFPDLTINKNKSPQPKPQQLFHSHTRAAVSIISFEK